MVMIMIIRKLTEAWPLSIKKAADYVCSGCVRNKKGIKMVSAQNSMISAQVAKNLQDLIQINFYR